MLVKAKESYGQVICLLNQAMMEYLTVFRLQKLSNVISPSLESMFDNFIEECPNSKCPKVCFDVYFC